MRRITSTTDRSPKPRYRYDDMSATIGGPVHRIPVLNRDKKSFNFFYSVEDMRLKDVNLLPHVHHAHGARARGDFSRPAPAALPPARCSVKDPLTGNPFPGNVIPSARRDPIGVALTDIFPLPNVSTPAYNF